MRRSTFLQRVLILTAALSTLPFSLCEPNCDREPDAQVLILGAGLAGLGAGRRLSQMGIDDFIILEQSDRIGGRVQSTEFAGTTIQLGPQWVFFVDESVPEAFQQPLWPLMQRCNVSVRDVPLGNLGSLFYTRQEGNITASPELFAALQKYSASTSAGEVNRVLAGLREGQDLTAASGLRESGWSPRTPIEELVEYSSFDFVVARPADTASYRDFYDPLVNRDRLFSFGTDITNYLVTDPYTDITDCLADEFLSPDDDRLILESTVHTISWGDECVCVTATKNGQDTEYCATYAILTFSVGELSSNNIVTFTPELPIAKRLELQKLEMANFLKIYIAFNETFWDTGVDFIFYHDEINGREYYPVFTPWGDYFPDKPPILETLLSGDVALRVAYQNLEITKMQIAEVMRSMYGEKASDPVDIIMHDFIVNPFYYGDFSSATPGVGASTFEELNHPIGQLHLAGEAYLSGLHSSAHAALAHGYQVGERIAEELIGPLTITLVNDSPKVDGNSVTAEFSISRSANLIECGITGRQRVDCSSGMVSFSNLDPDTYTLRIIARNEKDDRAVLSRRFYIGNGSQCAVHLINSGLSVYGDNAKVEFAITGVPVTDVLCSVDSQEFACEHPLMLKDLEGERHRVIITPRCGQSASLGYSRTFFI